MYERIGISLSVIPLKGHEFVELMRPVIEDLHRTTPKGERPEIKELASRARRSLRREWR